MELLSSENGKTWDLGQRVSLFPLRACHSPDSHNLTSIQDDPIHLGYENGCHSLVKGCTIHVNGRADWEDESGHTLVNP